MKYTSARNLLKSLSIYLPINLLENIRCNKVEPENTQPVTFLFKFLKYPAHLNKFRIMRHKDKKGEGLGKKLVGKINRFRIGHREISIYIVQERYFSGEYPTYSVGAAGQFRNHAAVSTDRSLNRGYYSEKLAAGASQKFPDHSLFRGTHRAI